MKTVQFTVHGSEQADAIFNSLRYKARFHGFYMASENDSSKHGADFIVWERGLDFEFTVPVPDDRISELPKFIGSIPFTIQGE